MRPPCEIVQKEFLPAVRSAVSHEMSRKGLSQNAIATKLGITQAAVSKYLNQPSRAKEFHGMQSLSAKISKSLLADETKDEEVLRILCSGCMSSRMGGSVCKKHRDAVSSLGIGQCNICSFLIAGRDDVLSSRALLLANVAQALEIMKTKESLAAIVPQVRSNLVACNVSAEDIDDVVGVPGRITVVNGKATALVAPEYGASSHTAELLLWVKKKHRRSNACFVVSGKEDALKAASEIGFNVISLARPTARVEEIIQLLEDKMEKKVESAQDLAIHVPGGVGIEPIVYLFGKNALNVIEAAAKVSELIRRKKSR